MSTFIDCDDDARSVPCCSAVRRARSASATAFALPSCVGAADGVRLGVAAIGLAAGEVPTIRGAARSADATTGVVAGDVTDGGVDVSDAAAPGDVGVAETVAPGCGAAPLVERAEVGVGVAERVDAWDGAGAAVRGVAVWVTMVATVEARGTFVGVGTGAAGLALALTADDAWDGAWAAVSAPVGLSRDCSALGSERTTSAVLDVRGAVRVRAAASPTVGASSRFERTRTIAPARKATRWAIPTSQSPKYSPDGTVPWAPLARLTLPSAESRRNRDV